MSEVHEALEDSIGLVLSSLGYKKNGSMKWFLPCEGFIKAVEIQKSRWSEQVFINVFVYISNIDGKPNKMMAYLTCRLGGVDVGLSDEEFNNILDLSKGNVVLKSKKIAEYLPLALKNTLNKLNSIEDLKFWLENKAFEKDGEFRFAHTSGNNVYDALGIET